MVVDRYKAALPFSDKYFHGNVVRCLDCNLGFLDQLPSLEQLKEFYSQVYRQQGSRHHQTDPGRQFKSFNPWARAFAFWDLIGPHANLSSMQAVADVGAGWGYFLLASRGRGTFARVAIETDAHAGAFLRESGFTLVPQMIEELDMDIYRGRFDVVALSHVLEHSTQPHIMLARVREMLKPGGWAVIEVPNDDCLAGEFAARGNDAPHILFFSREVLRGMLERAGFAVLHCENAGPLRNLPASGPRRKSWGQRVEGWGRSRILVRLNPRWGNPDMFKYGGNRAYIRALVRKTDQPQS
jgi:2-polyprenyl-3-methyl-5-hydroxy-6-metoxy-1,4-benzoquinol methylase